MRLVTYSRSGTPALGVVVDDRVLDVAAAAAQAGIVVPAAMQDLIEAGAEALDRLAALVASAAAACWQPLAETALLAPIPRPKKNVFCVGRNYKAHIEEGARARGVPLVFPTVPEFFSKPSTAVVGPDADIRLDTRLTDQLDYEVELALVIGKTCRDIPVAEAMSAVFGYTVLNDVTARDLQKRHHQWFKGKGLDTYCPVGPWIVTADAFGDPSGRRVTLRVNGETRQDSSTSDLLFDVATIVSVLSQGLTLEPGDIVATGTPAGVALGMTPQRWLVDGDIVEAEVGGVGILRNQVRAVA
ncbi:fumarylacetoacetate hydrolase family protein [Aquabacter spiritensis]|uniref:2-keto-4-pentenoate hydratase/2-oxohepta-3-ene-1,7-dioic acid hydratase in catechol pathway n=1 Tax=Aquabacter spiritensis TaxID=933073 RepID=A0A4R3LZM5_9HYPH|nr:fumarylacetoacetate hydrolase family protein [Aquabacter spiritensis]TCT06170.1 2-keto-4-pentenoate hydratase/2-oxohepta-3-ene-1,7-dioic acid hydratase in catechol pathway [Aquabacter spiritensis]